jgi:hypothetical protein
MQRVLTFSFQRQLETRTEGIGVKTGAIADAIVSYIQLVDGTLESNVINVSLSLDTAVRR